MNLFIFADGVYMEPKSKTWLPENAASSCTYTHTHTKQMQNKQTKSVHSGTGSAPEARVPCLRKPQLQSKLAHAAQLQQTPMGPHTAEVGSTETAKAWGGTMHFCCKEKK